MNSEGRIGARGDELPLLDGLFIPGGFVDSMAVAWGTAENPDIRFDLRVRQSEADLDDASAWVRLHLVVQQARAYSLTSPISPLPDSFGGTPVLAAWAIEWVGSELIVDIDPVEASEPVTHPSHWSSASPAKSWRWAMGESAFWRVTPI